MKTRFLRKAKSALSILLTLCVLVSCMSLGIISASAYDFTSGKIVYFDNSVTNWSNVYLRVGKSNYSNAYAMSKVSGTNNIYSYTIPSWGGYEAFSIANNSGWTGNNSIYKVDTGDTYDITGSTNYLKFNITSSIMIVPKSTNNTSEGCTYYNVCGVGNANTTTSDQGYFTTLNKSVSVTSVDHGTVSVSYTSGSGGTITEGNSANVLYGSTLTVTQTADTGYAASSYTGTCVNNSSSKTINNGTTCYIGNNGGTTTACAITGSFTSTAVALPTPTWSSSSVAVNAGTAATLTISNHSTIKGQDSGVTYVLKKGSTTLTSGTDYTFNNTSGVFTLTNTATSAEGSYTVQAIAANTVSYLNSAVSSAATLKVYEPIYSLSGNIIDYEALEINGSTPSKTNPQEPNSWFNQYQSAYAINNTTSTPGVYTLTFKVKDDYNWTPYVSIAQVGNTQRAFIYNNQPYNTATLGDLTVPDEGISSGLYLYNLASVDAGGSLKLRSGQTYTITIDQTQRYNSSSPWGKITITAADAFVDTVAKKKAFNATNRSYDSVANAEDTIGTATSAPYHGNKGNFTSTLTATVVNSNYTFTGWYTNADCTGNPVSTSASYNVVNPNNSITYYALFTQTIPSDYTVGITNPTGGTITLTGGVASAPTTSSSTAYAGATVGLSINVSDHGKEFSRWKITATATGADVSSTVLNSGATDSSATFTMPDYAVTVTAILNQKTPVNIIVTSNNTALGTATYTTGTYYIGESIPISATNDGGVFTKWQVTGGTLASATNSSTTVTATGTTVTVKAIFDYKTYQLYYNGTKYVMLRQNNGTYVSTRTVNSGGGQFTIYDVSANKYAVTSSNPYGLHNGWKSGQVSSWDSSSSKNKYGITDSGSYYVRFDPSNGTNGTVDIIANNPMGDIAEIYAKDGSIRYATEGNTSGDLWESNHGGVTCNRGVTVVTKIDGTNVPNPDSKKYPSTGLSEHLKVYSAPIGTSITIQTTVNSTYKNKGFYVGMFVINGWKVAASDMGNGVYSATYSLDNDYSVDNKDSNKSFEITPVYYNKNFEYITFYVDAASVPDKWGKTISACADYNGATDSHFEGTYPGQPLGREGDLYELKVAKSYYTYSSNKWSAQTQYQPSVTITAYNYDNVHHFYYVEKDDTLNTGNKNYQTYDFSDFNWLAKIEDVEAILFRCKYETSKSSWQIYNKSDNEANYDPNTSEPSWYNVSSTTSFNNWQVLTDYYGNPIDAFGNRIAKTGGGYYTSDDVSSLTLAANGDVRIVSYGNRKSDGTTTTRTRAQWATGWVVYTKGSTGGTKYYKATGAPSDFICTTPGDTATSNVKYYSGGKESDIKGKITFITYDKERTNQISGVGDTGERIDGQWYYSALHDFDSEVKVAITTESVPTSSNTTIEDNSNSEDTGFIGTTSGTKATLDEETVKTYSNVSTDAELNCTLGAGYTFVGWYIYDGSTYTKIGDNYADLSTTMLMKKNYTIVAVVKAVGAGDLVITHSKYTGSSPEAFDGTGKYYVSAKITHNDQSVTEIPESQNSITVSNLRANDSIEITLRTVCNGDDTFYAWYEEALGENYARTGKYYEICDENDDPLGEKEVSYTFFPADCSTFFSGNTLTRKTLDFYSDITHVSAFATLTYKYYDRFAVEGKGKLVSYVVKNIELTADEIEAGYIPSDEKIQKYAPDVVDTIYRDTKWTIIGTKVQRTASNITLMATQEEKECYVQYIPSTAVASTLLQSSTTETAIGSVPSWTNTTVKFNSWLTSEEKDMTNWDPSDYIVSAPESYTYESGGNSTTWNFVRFDVYSVNRNTGAIGNMLFSVNDSIFGYRIYNDCVIYPVYTRGEVESELTANIEPAVLNREVYGESTSPTDKLYADLIVSFINTKSIIGTAAINEFGTYNTSTKISQGEYEGKTYTVETGVILDRGVNLSVDDYNFLKTQGTNRDTDYTNNILSEADYHYPEKFNSAATIASGLEADNITFGSAKVYGNGISHNYIKYKNDNSLLTNKNRLDKVIIFTNNEKAQKAVFAAYSYVIITNTTTGDKTIAVSNPQLFNFAYVGNKPLTS